MRVARVAQLCLLFACATACEDGEAEGRGPRRMGDAAVGGDVVATVDGVPITVSDVERVARGAHLSPREALASLEDRALLAGEAERRGYADRPEVRTAGERAMVQALLALEVEDFVTPQSIPEADARERWQSSTRWNRPERRATTHVLARIPEGSGPATVRAAEEIARDAVSALRAVEGDPGATAAVVGELRGSARDGISVVVEELPPMARDARLEAPYVDAMFSLDSEGVVPHAVRTTYGFHAIIVTDIEPAVAVPFEEAEPEVRAEIATELRRTRVETLIESLRDRQEVQVHEGRVRDALAIDLFEAP